MKYLLSILMVGMLFTSCIDDKKDDETNNGGLVGSSWEFTPADANPEYGAIGFKFTTIDKVHRYLIMLGDTTRTGDYTYIYKSSDLSKVTFVQKSNHEGDPDDYLYGTIDGDKLTVTDAPGSADATIITFIRVK